MFLSSRTYINVALETFVPTNIHEFYFWIFVKRCFSAAVKVPFQIQTLQQIETFSRPLGVQFCDMWRYFNRKYSHGIKRLSAV